MRLLTERILEALPRMDAPLARDMAAKIGSDEAHVRSAYDALEASGRAKIVRRGAGLHLVPADTAIRICPVCRSEIAGRGRTCSKSCGMKVAWIKRDRAVQADVIRASWERQPEKMAEGIRKRLASSEHKEHLRRLNTKLWADPVNKMKRRVSMEAAWQGPQANDRRAKAQTQKSVAWATNRNRLIEGMLIGKRGRFQRAAIKLVAGGASDEEIAFQTGRTMEQTKTLLRRLFKQGKSSRAPIDGRKIRQIVSRETPT